MNRFYLTLPSNSSMDYYPHNTNAEYTTKLTHRIELDGDWEMALVETSFPVKVQNIICRDAFIRIHHSGINAHVVFAAETGYYKQADVFVQNLMANQRKVLDSISTYPWLNIRLTGNKKWS